MQEPVKNAAASALPLATPPCGVVPLEWLSATFTEAQMGLPNRLGMTSEKVRAWRDLHLVEQQDWAHLAAGVFWTAAAVARLFAAHEVPAVEIPLPAVPERRQVQVWKLTRNPRVLMAVPVGCTLPAENELLGVWVRAASAWKKGQVMTVEREGNIWKQVRG